MTTDRGASLVERVAEVQRRYTAKNRLLYDTPRKGLSTWVWNVYEDGVTVVGRDHSDQGAAEEARREVVALAILRTLAEAEPTEAMVQRGMMAFRQHAGLKGVQITDLGLDQALPGVVRAIIRTALATATQETPDAE